MKYQVNKEFLLTANEEEMEMLALAVRNQIKQMAKEVAESGELIRYPNPAQAFIEMKTGEWFGLFENLCKAMDTVKSRREYDMMKEGLHNIFEKEKEKYSKEIEKRDKLDEEINYPF